MYRIEIHISAVCMCVMTPVFRASKKGYRRTFRLAICQNLISSKYFHKMGPLFHMLLTNFAFFVTNLRKSQHLLFLAIFCHFRIFSQAIFVKMRKFFYLAKIRKQTFFVSTLTGAQTWHRRHTLLPYTHCCLHSIRTAPSQLYMRTAYGVYVHAHI